MPLQEGSPEGQKGTRDRGEASLLGVSPEEEQREVFWDRSVG